MKERAYSQLVIKAVAEDKRIITGIATSPEPDRLGDIVEPLGVTVKGHIPLLWMHQHDLPVGSVKFGKATKEGLPFEASLPMVSEPSQLKARIDEAWQSIKAGLVRAVSIGFRPLEYSVIEETGGLRFTKTDVYELSLVTVPAQPNATIQQIKAYDRTNLTSKGKMEGESKTLNKDPQINVGDKAAKAKKTTIVKLNPEEGNMSKRMKQFKDELEKKIKRLDDIMEKSGDEGVTLSADEQDEFDNLETEIKTLQAQIKRFESVEALKKDISGAVEITEKSGQEEKSGAEVRSKEFAQVKRTEKLEKGIEFTRYAMCKLKAKGDANAALQLAKRHYGNSDRIIKALQFEADGGNYQEIMKAAVSAGNTINSTWAKPLVEYNDFSGDFVDYLRPRTIVGQFGTGNIPSLRKIPFNVHIKGQTSGGSASWVGEGKPKPVTKFDYNDTYHGWNKIAAIAVLTEELIRFSDPSAEALVRDGLSEAIIERLDDDFINPNIAAIANVRPASILNGASHVASSGSDADAVRCDLQALWQVFIAANNVPRSGVYLMNSTIALALSQMRNPLGQAEFPGITINGGMLEGVPVIVSDYVPLLSNGSIVALVNASDIYISDDGQVTVDASREASIQMLDSSASGAGAPTNDSITPTPTTLVSMFQTNSVAFRAEMFVTYSRRRASAAAYLTAVNWGTCNS